MGKMNKGFSKIEKLDYAEDVDDSLISTPARRERVHKPSGNEAAKKGFVALGVIDIHHERYRKANPYSRSSYFPGVSEMSDIRAKRRREGNEPERVTDLRPHGNRQSFSVGDDDED